MCVHNTQRVLEAVDEQATEVQREQLKREAEALDERAEALTAQSEAQRPQDEASLRKAARKGNEISPCARGTTARPRRIADPDVRAIGCYTHGPNPIVRHEARGERLIDGRSRGDGTCLCLRDG